MQSEQAAASPTRRAGAVWRGVVVGVVAIWVLQTDWRLGLCFVLLEVAYFTWLARRMGDAWFGSRRFVLAAIAGAAFVVGMTLLLFWGHAVATGTG